MSGGVPSAWSSAQLDELCRSFLGSVQEFPFGPETAVYKVGGKIFALSTLDNDPLSVNLKCEPFLAEQLRSEHPDSILPGYHMNKRHWNTVRLDGSLDRELVCEMIEDSYDLVVEGLPKVQRP